MNRNILKRNSLRMLAAAAILVVGFGALLWGKRNDFGLGRNMEITVNMMRELSLYYVDEVDPDRLMEGAAEGMVSDLDPYTEYMPEEQMSSFELLTTGKYGGVGVLILFNQNAVVYFLKQAARLIAGIQVFDFYLDRFGTGAQILIADFVLAQKLARGILNC